MTKFHKKASKPHFGVIFVNFISKEILPEKFGSVRHNAIWTPNNMLRKKLIVNSKDTSGQMQVRRTGKPKSIGSFQPRPGVQLNINKL